MRIHTAIVVLMLVTGSLFFPDAASAQHRNPDGSCSITVTGINGEPSHEQAAPEEECAAWEKFEAQKRREAALRIMLLIGSVVLAAAVCAAWVWQRRRRKATAAAPGTPGSESKATPSAPAGRTASSEESAFGHGGAEAMPSSSGKDSQTTESPRGAQGVRPAVLADAIAHYNARRYSEAQTALAAAHAAGADPEQCFYYSALAHLSTGNLTAAKQQLEKTVSLAPRNPDAHFYLGELLMKEGAVDAALNHFRSVASLRPDHARARQRLSQLQPSEAAKSGGGGHGAAPAGVAHREGASTVRYGPWHAERQQEHVHEQDQVHVDAEPRRGDPYDLLRGAKDDVSQAAVSLIRETRVEPRKPIMRAYLGTRLMLLAAVAALFLLGIVGVNVGNSYHQSAMDTYYRLKGNGQDIPFATADVVQQLDIRFAAEARIASLIE
jgi:TolA-binding protein